MAYSPPATPVPAMVSILLEWVGQPGPYTNNAAPASYGFSAANLAFYIPVFLPAPCVVRRLWWANGSTVSASYNVDCGIYADSGYAPGKKLVSTGSTAQGTASEVQFVDVTDTSLPSGLYWLALSCSSASPATFKAWGSTDIGVYWNASGHYEEASAVPLPATATPIEAAYGLLPLCGFATTTSP